MTDQTPANKTPANVTMTNEQLQALLQGVVSQFINTTAQTTAAAADETAARSVRSGNFAQCQSRFSGEKNEDIDAFIDGITVYKDCVNITEVNALKGLPMLLDKSAATWFQGAKSTFTTWEEALDGLRHAFGQKQPPHRIFRELFEREQGEDEQTDVFVSRCRALIAQLPAQSKLSDTVQLDMVYGLLHYQIRERLTRDACEDFNTLISKARAIETTLSEARNKEKSLSEKAKVRPKCTFCHNFGHVSEDCRKRAKKPIDKSERNDVVTPVTGSATRHKEEKRPGELVCYACRTPGHVRSECPNRVKRTMETASVEVLAADLRRDDHPPMLAVTIEHLKGLAQVDTGARCSIAGVKLYQHLLSQDCVKVDTRVNMALADGVVRDLDAVQIHTVVNIANREVPLTFIAIPQFANNKSLLGLDFIRAAGLVLDVTNNQWSFADEPENRFSFEKIPEVSKVAVNSIDIALRSEEGATLSPSERQQLAELLEENADIFQRKTAPTTFAEHSIRLTTDDPIAVPPYRMSQHRKEILGKELETMMDEDIIEECDSPYAAPVVLIPKKDNQFRVCVDYRELNKVTIPDRYPLPRVDDLLHAAKQTAYMSTIDLRSGYWQVPVRESDRDKTAFITPFGLYRFKRMPFGLCSAPATFQRLIDRLKTGLSDILILAYLDDLIIISAAFTEHLKDLQCVFDRLRLYGLYANRAKCTFAGASVRYLGHLITPGGICPDREKISAIVDRPNPINLKQLQSFLQTCNWFRRFIEDYAEIVRPLCALTKKKAVFEWGPEQQRAFDALKDKLTSAPVLRQADPDSPYRIKTDASSYAVGACLLQGEGDDERPIEYVSRLLTAAEQNYTTTEKEALAVVYAVEKFRGYIEGASVSVSTDHRPLRWLMKLRNPMGRLARWALLLQQFNLQIDYIPGRTNVVADTLSRPGGECEETVTINRIEVHFPKKSAKETRDEQLQDPDVRKIICCLEEEATDPGKYQNYWASRGYCLSNGVLYRYTPDGDADEPQLVVPTSMVMEILRENHDADTAGHYGVAKTCEKIARRYYWTTLHRDVAKHVKTCIDCQRYKASNTKPAGLVQSHPLARRFEVMAMDLFGPLPEAATGERWVLAVEDVTTRWIELFALQVASAAACARVVIDDVILRYGCPRKVTSDNGTQFVSDVFQQVAYILGFEQRFTALYHPEANPEERRNRELKTQLAILVKMNHSAWKEALPSVRFAMNTTNHASTGFSPAYLTFGRELRTPFDAHRDLRDVIEDENVIEEITPYLRLIEAQTRVARENIEHGQLRAKQNADKHRRESVIYRPGDQILVDTHVLSNAARGFTSKFAPRRDGPYVILDQATPTTYTIATLEEPDKPLGKYHSSALRPYCPREEAEAPSPLIPKRQRGRPRKDIEPPSQDETASSALDEEGPLEGLPVESLSEMEPEPGTTRRTRRMKKMCTASCCAE